MSDVKYWQCVLRRKSDGSLIKMVSYESTRYHGTLEEAQRVWADNANSPSYEVVGWLPFPDYLILRDSKGSVEDVPEFWASYDGYVSTPGAPGVVKSKKRPPDKGPLWWEAKFVTGDDMMKAIRAMSSVPMPMPMPKAKS
jgi:hypothetical protein